MAEQMADETLGEQLGSPQPSRRLILQGLGALGVAAVGSGLITTRASFAAAATPSQNTVVVVFLRGAADALSILVPAAPSLGLDYLNAQRPKLLPQRIALPGQSGWALNAKLQPLYNTLWSTGELAFVPAVSAPGVSMSHFQAQSYLEKGGSDTLSSGWLDRLLPTLGRGTNFRAVGIGTSSTPVSMLGTTPVLNLDSLSSYKFPRATSYPAREIAAVRSLYRDMRTHPLGQDVDTALDTLASVGRAQSHGAAQNGATYPDGAVGQSFADLATLLRAELGMRVATVDVGGWDTHTNQASRLDSTLTQTASALSAFMTDLGSARRSRVTVVVMTEFGRRVQMNASGGTDHGHGSVMWLLGGGLKGSGVYGRWDGLDASLLDSSGNVPGWNNAFDVLGELATRRLNAGTLTGAFPDHVYTPMGVAA
jgi:uncharacterized protein (DUF1501 family)